MTNHQQEDLLIFEELLATTLLAEVPSSTGELLVKAFKSKDFKLPFPSVSCDYISFSNDYLFYSLYRKLNFPDKELNEKRRVLSLAGWKANEEKNLVTNRRVGKLLTNQEFPDHEIVRVISDAQLRITNLLGEFVEEKVLEACRWGPGATVDIKRSDYVDTKITKKMTSTRYAIPYIKSIIENDYHWGSAITGLPVEGPYSLLPCFFEVCEYSKMKLVPKDFSVDRPIDLQPTANSYLQQGVGQYIRRRLRNWNIDLNDQSHNQNAAFEAVFSGLATIDLKNASDTIASSVVQLLLPYEWYEYLSRIRTSQTLIQGENVPMQLNKFSAMGNAFTFELESMIFHSLICSIHKVLGFSSTNCLTYGDDLIVDSRVKDLLIRTFDYLGFSLNMEKSFFSPPFFESCGKHFFLSEEVTPIYQKCLVSTPEECIRLHNRLVRWAFRMNRDPCDIVETLSLIVLRFSFLREGSKNEHIFPTLPYGSVSDDGFLCDQDSSILDENGGFYTYVYRPSRKDYLKLDHRAYLQLRMRSFAKRKTRDNLPLSDAPRRFMNALDVSESFQNSDPKGRVSEKCGDSLYKLSRVYKYAT